LYNIDGIFIMNQNNTRFLGLDQNGNKIHVTIVNSNTLILQFKQATLELHSFPANFLDFNTVTLAKTMVHINTCQDCLSHRSHFVTHF